MSVERIFEVVCTKLPEAGIDFLMIGGHAVNHYGFSRATLDVDFMVAANDVPAVRDAMTASGFTNVSEGVNVVFFNHPDSSIRVDFLPVDEETLATLLGDAVAVKYGDFDVKVPSLGNLIAMKLFALGNPKRMERDSADIVHLVVENGLSPEGVLKPLCERFSTQDVYRELERRIKEMNHA